MEYIVLLLVLAGPFQLPEYQTDVQRCRFDTLGKSTPAHRGGAPIDSEQWVCSRTEGESHCLIATVTGPPTTQEHFKLLLHSGCTCYSGDWTIQLTQATVLLHCGRGRFPLKYKPSSLLRPHRADKSALAM